MNAPRLSLRQLQIFRAVAEHGGTTQAAEAVSLSQSATSAAISELERLLGLRLFDRIGKRLLLNDNGRSLLPQARAVLDSAASVEQWARQGDAQVGEVRIGASTTIGNYLLPGLLAQFRKHLPESAREPWPVQVYIANSAEVVREVTAFNLDFGLIEGPCHAAELEVTPWREDELLVVASADHALATRRRVSISALREATWLLREAGSGTRETVNQLLLPHLHQLKSGMEFGNSEAIKRAAAAGLGLTCLSRSVVQDFIDASTLLKLRTELPPLSRQLHLISHRRKHRTQGLNRLLDFLRQPAPRRRR